MKRSKIFISYARKDKQWLYRVRNYLRLLEYLVYDSSMLWDDTQINPGSEWDEEISNALDEARIAVLLITPDFIASDFIREKELPPLVKAHKNKEVEILSLHIKHTSLEKFEDL